MTDMDKGTIEIPIYATYLYPVQREDEDFAWAERRLRTRLREAGLVDFDVVTGGGLGSSGFWAMEVHFPNQTREDVFPKLPEDLVNPEG